MRNCWRLFKSDVRHLTGNVISLMVVVGLVAIPSLFSWYNLLACWNVFDNTGNLKVAVANVDEGYQSDLVPLKIEIGESVVAALRANDQLDWVFTDQQDAIDGAASGRYYAAVVIPQNFSRAMMSFFSDEVEHADILYYTNEKINAIAPKMTDIGADSVSDQVNSIFEERLSEVALQMSSALADYVDRADAQGQLAKLGGHIGQMGDQLDRAAGLLQSYEDIFSVAATVASGSNDLIAQTRQTADDTTEVLGSAAEGARTGADALKTAEDELEATLQSLEQTGDDAQKVIQDGIDGAVQTARSAENALRKTARLARTNGLDDIADRLTTAADRLGHRLENATTERDETAGHVKSAFANLGVARNNVGTTAEKAVDSLTGNLDAAKDALDEGARALEQAGDQIGTGSRSLAENLENGRAKLDEAQTTLRESGSGLRDVGQKIIQAATQGDGAALRKIIGSNPAALAAHLATPVQLERIAVHAVDNFGSAMAPLYTTLALWIGSLLIMVAMKPQPTPQVLESLGRPTLRQVFFGRFLVLGTISILQSTLLAAGNLLFVGVQAQHPWLYMVCFWVSGLVFTFIIYTLVALFANLGKALGVVLLVVQISGGAGSYPLALLPEPVQALSPFLPITHAVSAMRAAMFGVYHNDFWIEIGQLALFVVPLLVLVLVLIRPLKFIVPRFVERIEASKLM